MAQEQQPTMGFTVFLSEVAGGAALCELNDKFALLTKRLSSHAHDWGECKGELAFKVQLRAENDGRVTAVYSVKMKLPPEPEPHRPTGRMYLGGDGSLTAKNPRQPDLPHTSEPREAPPVVVVVEAAHHGNGASNGKSKRKGKKLTATLLPRTPSSKKSV
jgi:hypothetical protein